MPLRKAGTADYTNLKGGEHHEAFGFVSYDSSRKTNVFRQFTSKGFVNQYVPFEIYTRASLSRLKGE
jgi:hypothetical protein